MPPAHLFLVDVSHQAVATGLTAAACAAIAGVLDDLQGAPAALGLARSAGGAPADRKREAPVRACAAPPAEPAARRGTREASSAWQDASADA
jgi:hypothetical protein